MNTSNRPLKTASEKTMIIPIIGDLVSYKDSNTVSDETSFDTGLMNPFDGWNFSDPLGLED